MSGTSRKSLPTLSCVPPYIVKDSWFSKAEPPRPETSDDQDQIIELNARVLQWCENRRFIEAIEDGRYTPILSKNRSSFRHLLYASNMRTMVYTESLHELLKIARDNDLELMLTSLQQLSIQLIAIYGVRVVNLVLNRLYKSYDSIPVDDADRTWDELHQDYPFFWIILLAHTLMNFHCNPAPPLFDV